MQSWVVPLCFSRRLEVERRWERVRDCVTAVLRDCRTRLRRVGGMVMEMESLRESRQAAG